MRDRGVSDLIGFVLIFGMILSTVGVVYVYGIGGLEDARGAERVNNAERAFDVLADNVADLVNRDAPSRATEVKLADADLGFGESTTVRITLPNVAGSPFTEKSIDPIVYSADDTTEIVYANGAVIRTDRSGGVMLQNPPTVFTTQNGNRVAALPLVETRSEGPVRQVGGSSTVLIRSKAVTRDLLMERTDPSADGVSEYEVELTVEAGDAEQAVAWKRHLESDIPSAWDTDGSGDTCEQSGETVTCTLTVHELYVPRTGISVRFN